MRMKATFLETWKARRIERILKAPESRVLALGWVKRLLCVIVVVAAYADLFGLLISATYEQYDWRMTKNSLVFLSPLVMITAFLLLRKAMRKVTSLPDQYLDEREIENRDWAFKFGYLVVRRIGLGMVVGFLTLVFISWINNVNHSTVTSSFELRESPIFKAEVWFQQYVESLLNQSGALGFGFGVFFLLTFVAYSFPLILLAWREARFSTVPEFLSTEILASTLTANARRYFWKLLAAGLMVPLSISASFFMPGLLWNLLFISLGYSLYLYFWGLIKIAVALRELKGRSKALLWLLLASSLVGIWVPVALFSPLLADLPMVGTYAGVFPTRLQLVFIPAFTLIPLQVVSFAVLRLEAKRLETAVKVAD